MERGREEFEDLQVRVSVEGVFFRRGRAGMGRVLCRDEHRLEAICCLLRWLMARGSGNEARQAQR